jgi:hypothetical protein
MTIFYCLKFETPQPGGQGPRIYIPQEQGGPVIPPGTGFTFRRLLRLAGLRWRYWNPPAHGVWFKISRWSSLCRPGPDHRENTASIVECQFLAAEMCLSRRCLAMTVSSRSTIPTFNRHVTK